MQNLSNTSPDNSLNNHYGVIEQGLERNLRTSSIEFLGDKVFFTTFGKDSTCREFLRLKNINKFGNNNNEKVLSEATTIRDLLNKRKGLNIRIGTSDYALKIENAEINSTNFSVYKLISDKVKEEERFEKVEGEIMPILLANGLDDTVILDSIIANLKNLHIDGTSKAILEINDVSGKVTGGVEAIL